MQLIDESDNGATSAISGQRGPATIRRSPREND
jgi:hypothetical protein